ncbi:MAG: alkaline phytoceramidase [Bdellovibrionales bacterium]|nr:alkaline phytoceramidase [Massilia sp.]
MQLTQIRPNFVPGIVAVLILAMLLYGPIAQPANYHHFADARSLFGIPNAGDVLSNIGFLLAGAYGLVLWRRSPEAPERSGYGAFFAAVALTAAGSTWYHLAPDNAGLVWDRLPIALACAALLSGELRRAYPDAGWARASLPALCLAAAASVAWWSMSGDLRPYLFIQVAPLLLIPALQWQKGEAKSRRTAFAVAIGLYVLAKMCEVADASLFEALGVMSGHTLKHMLAFAAALVLARQNLTR